MPVYIINGATNSLITAAKQSKLNIKNDSRSFRALVMSLGMYNTARMVHADVSSPDGYRLVSQALQTHNNIIKRARPTVDSRYELCLMTTGSMSIYDCSTDILHDLLLFGDGWLGSNNHSCSIVVLFDVCMFDACRWHGSKNKKIEDFREFRRR